MFKKNLIAAAVGLAASIGVVSSAQAAFYLNEYNGAVKFVFSNFDMGTTYLPSSPFVPFENICADVATCDAAAVAPAPGAIGSEDTWGIFQIHSIVTDDNNNTILWTQGQGGNYLTGMFHGLTDSRVDYAVGNITAAAIGGGVQIYLDNQIADYTAGAALGVAGRTSANQFTGATNGQLFLDMAFAGTANAFYAGAGYSSTFAAGSLNGSGIGYLDFIGGDYLPLFQQDTKVDALGGLHDAKLSAVYSPNANAPLWTVTSTGDNYTGVIPEPGSMALAGLGLMALAGLRRRKPQA